MLDDIGPMSLDGPQLTKSDQPAAAPPPRVPNDTSKGGGELAKRVEDGTAGTQSQPPRVQNDVS